MENERFVIDSDSKAGWAMRKIREADAELERMKAWYKAQIEAAQKEHDGTVEYMSGLLREYFATVPAKETKTQSKYALPDGDMVMMKPKREFVQDDPEALLDWCRANDASLVKVSLSPRWADIKARLIETDAGIVDKDTGLTVEGVRAEDKPEEFKVRVKEDNGNV